MPTTFTAKDWRDLPDTSTPLSAVAIEDIETRITDWVDSGVHTFAGTSTFSAKQTFGSGDQFSITGESLTGRKVHILDGTSASPITVLEPTFKVSKYDNVTQATKDAWPGANAGGQALDHTAAIVGGIEGGTLSELQVTGVVGHAKQKGTAGQSDACGIMGHGWIQTSGDGNALGAYLVGRKDVTAAKAFGAEIRCQNVSGVDESYDPAGSDGSQYILMGASSFGSRVACGIKFIHGTGNHKVDVGIGVSSNDGGLFLSSTFRDDGEATRSLDIRGVHSYAMRVETTAAGVIEMRRTAGTDNAFQILNTAAGTTFPTLIFRGDGRVSWGDGISAADVHALWLSAGKLRLSGSMRVDSELEIDGNLNHDGVNVGFYNTAPAAKQTVSGSRGGNAALASLLTALSTIGLITDSSTA